MVWSAPTLEDMRASVSRDLRDPSNNTFTTDEVDDLVRMGIVEVSRIHPKEEVRLLMVESALQDSFACDALALFRVEAIGSDGYLVGVPVSVSNEDAAGGWDLHGGTLYLPGYIFNRFTSVPGPSVRVWGYWPRDVLTEDAEVFDGDADAEYATRAYALTLGYQRLQNDRVKSQQWMTTTGNTDVSPNQLAQTADMYQSEWRAYRQRIRTLQRQ